MTAHLLLPAAALALALAALPALAQDAETPPDLPPEEMEEEFFDDVPVEPSIVPALPFGFSDIATGLQFCNDSGRDDVTLALLHSADAGWISEGFWLLHAGECVVVLNELTNRFVYYHARTEGQDWSGDAPACISAGEEFEFDPFQCPDGSKTVAFREIDTEGQPAFTEYLE